MNCLIEPVAAVDKTIDTILYNNTLNRVKHSRRCRRVLKSKENTIKHKCNKALKRKLKQYKLRPDGKEDQDILDVSHILINSLIIKSPGSKEKENNIIDRPKNYLFRMVRNKQKLPNGDTENALHNIECDTANPVVSQDKKQTNAFQLLMDSRNKSIGSNSPGKEKINDENLDQEIIERKNVKVKRILVLQKMAEAKGSLKKKEMEECQDKYIKIQMKKRAEKFKNMLLNQEPKSQDSKEKTHQKFKSKFVESVSNSNKELVNDKEIEVKQVKSLQLVNLFGNNPIELDKKRVKKTTELLKQEDKEFLEKLSPSLKKKENMLCYFSKIEKESEHSPNNSDDDVIKVKLPSKSKSKGKCKKKTIPGNNVSNICNENVIQNVTNISAPNEKTPSNDRQKKRKRNFSLMQQEMNQTSDVLEENQNRPKRNVKKPIKYNDDLFMLSSDEEELHIFTPKKKRHTDNIQQPKVVKSSEDTQHVELPKSPKLVVKSENQTKLKNNIKLAPIFNSKQKLDAVTSQAKQKFLQSGVPEKLKKKMAQQKSNNAGEVNFQIVVHVQQKDCLIGNFSYPNINIINTSVDDDSLCQLNESKLFNSLLNLKSFKLNEKVFVSNTNFDISKVLQHIKLTKPKFPVYRTYRLLRDKKKGEFRGTNYLDFDNSVEVSSSMLEMCNENPDQLSWTDKYKAMSTNQIIGNYESVKELKKWLVLWTEMHQKTKSNGGSNSDSSDFYHSDTDSRDSAKSSNNLLIMTGPTGSGKTSSVYAVAADLAIKVIEVNASSKRTGKIMLQDLQEATQSHKVNRGATSDNITKSQEVTQVEIVTKSKKRGRPKKNMDKKSKETKKEKKQNIVNVLSGSQEIARTDTSLILIDDADIVFDQDDGFCSAIAQLVHSSKRPVILVTSSLSYPHLQRFVHHSKILKMNPLSPRILGTWLDLICLADTGACCLDLGAKLLNYFKGDVRKTINSLQFYVSSQPQTLDNENIASQASDTYKLNIEEEKSNGSWADQEYNEEKTVVKSETFETETGYLWNNFINAQLSIDQFKSPFERFDIWWNLPQLLDFNDNNVNTSRLESIANVADCISISDFFCHITPNSRPNITSEPWFSFECHSVSEQEDMNYYRRCAEVCDEISFELIRNSIEDVHKSSIVGKITNIDFPGMTSQRERDRIVSRHNNLTNYLSPSAVMDRRALALDYWATCRTICRIEKTKSDNYTKRNNRFCHYLKSLNIRCNNESFDNLCDSLSSINNCGNGLQK